MRGVAIIYMCALAACAAGTPGNPDAPVGGAADASVDAPGTTDAPDLPDAADLPDADVADAMSADAMPDAGVVTTAPDTCAQALDITTDAHAAGGAQYSADTTGYADDVSPASTCTGYLPDGPDAIYAVTLAANETITATATPATSWDISLELVQPCTYDATCAAGSDSGFAGDPESVTYTATAAGTYFVVVDGYNPGVEGPFTLSVHVQ